MGNRLDDMLARRGEYRFLSHQNVLAYFNPVADKIIGAADRHLVLLEKHGVHFLIIFLTS